MLKKSIEKILNEQIEKEFYSSNLYLSMSLWASTNGFEGVAEWMKEQAGEEYEHMERIVKYLLEKNATPIVPALSAPPTNFKNVQHVFEESLKHEQFVTASINKIMDLVVKEKDYATQNWLNWFVDEQVEEEANVQQILDKLKIAGDKYLYLFDKDIMSLRGE